MSGTAIRKPRFNHVAMSLPADALDAAISLGNGDLAAKVMVVPRVKGNMS